MNSPDRQHRFALRLLESLYHVSLTEIDSEKYIARKYPGAYIRVGGTEASADLDIIQQAIKDNPNGKVFVWVDKRIIR